MNLIRLFILVPALAVALTACGSEAVTSSPHPFFVLAEDSRYEARRMQPVGTQPEPQPEQPEAPKPQPEPMPTPPQCPPGATRATTGECTQTVETSSSYWLLSPVVTPLAGGSYNVVIGFDFAKAQLLDGVFDMPIQLPSEAAKAKSIALTWSLSAEVKWAQPSADCQGKATLITAPGNWRTCVPQSFTAGLVVGTAFSGGTQPAAGNIAAASPLGTAVAAQAGDKITLRLRIAGNATVSKLAGSVAVRMTY